MSNFKSVFVLILICGHESWVMTKRVLSFKYKQNRWDFC